jgi:3-deoxy-D-manno-octulosonic-acid transferase
MINAYDIGYRALIGATWPLWASRRRVREKVRDAFATRDGTAPKRIGNGPAVLVHAVSVGELNAARELIDALVAARPELHVIVTTTTTAGNELAQKIFGPRDRTTVVRFPIDLTPSIDRLLDATRPTAVVLMELEVWPNFLKQCERRKIPVVIANGRITLPSFHKYRLLGPLAWAMFGRLEKCIAQDETYAERFMALGVPRGKLEVSGTMKFDAATVGETVPGAEDLARDVGLGEPQVFVAGSTGPGEEEIVLDVYARLRQSHANLRLVIVPRKPERFDEVAKLIESRGHAYVRRSRARSSAVPEPSPLAPVILGDTMGELRKFYALATVVFVGRTLVDLGPKQHGSDMIEPCALGKPSVVGPFTGNFEEPMRAFRTAEAIVEVRDADGLFDTLDGWLRDPDAARALGRRARDVVVAGKGAVARHVEVLLPLLG